MFHQERIEEVKKRIAADLRLIDLYGSVKLYLCWYDEFLIAKEDWNGLYPCSDNYVQLKDVIDIVKDIMKCPYIIRYNSLSAQVMPAFLISSDEDECEKYVEVCKVFNTDK